MEINDEESVGIKPGTLPPRPHPFFSPPPPATLILGQWSGSHAFPDKGDKLGDVLHIARDKNPLAVEDGNLYDEKAALLARLLIRKEAKKHSHT